MYRDRTRAKSNSVSQGTRNSNDGESRKWAFNYAGFKAEEKENTFLQ